MKKVWCNPPEDDECIVNRKKVAKAEPNKYLPAIYELKVLNVGGYCEHPTFHDKNDKPVCHSLEIKAQHTSVPLFFALIGEHNTYLKYLLPINQLQKLNLIPITCRKMLQQD